MPGQLLEALHVFNSQNNPRRHKCVLPSTVKLRKQTWKVTWISGRTEIQTQAVWLHMQTPHPFSCPTWKGKDETTVLLTWFKAKTFYSLASCQSPMLATWLWPQQRVHLSFHPLEWFHFPSDSWPRNCSAETLIYHASSHYGAGPLIASWRGLWCSSESPDWNF